MVRLAGAGVFAVSNRGHIKASSSSLVNRQGELEARSEPSIHDLHYCHD